MSSDWSSLRPWRELSDATRELILNGDDSREGHKVAYSVALGMRNAGRRDFGQFEQVMTNRDNGCSRWYYEIRDGRPAQHGQKRKNARGQEATQRELRRTWQATLKAEAPANPDYDRSEIRMACERARRRAAQVLPTGQATRTTLRVFDELTGLAVAHKRLAVTASCRQLAELAGVNKDTAARHLAFLCQVGAIQPIGQGQRRHSEAAAYAIVSHHQGPGEGGNSVDTQSHSVRGGEKQSVYPVATSAAQLPIWRRIDLGETGRLVHSTLDVDEPLSAKELHRRSGVGYRTVRGKLPALAQRGLAVRTPDGWLRGAANPAEVASSDAIEAAELAKVRHQTQRHGWQTRLPESHWPQSGVLAAPVEPRSPTYSESNVSEGNVDNDAFNRLVAATHCRKCGGKIRFGEEHLGIHTECEFPDLRERAA